ncbi:MAG: hypothetical protein AB7X49_16155, partial [Geminicoccaceae bacterium]
MLRLLSMLVLLVPVEAAAADPAPLPAAAPPDFSDVDDVLLGRRLVLPVQDLVLSPPGDGQNTILQTEQGNISNTASYGVAGTILSTASGRVFDLPNDVVVTMVTGSSAGSAQLDIRDPLGNRSLTIPLPNGICTPSEDCNPNIVTLGDMTGDGYDEIVISYAGGGLQVASAMDVSDFSQGLRLGEVFDGNATVPVPTTQALAVGDLNGDGLGELAAVDLPQFEIYRLVPPGEGEDPSLDLERASAIDFDPPGATGYAVQIGQIDDDLKDLELVVAVPGASDGNTTYLGEVASDLTFTLEGANFTGETSANLLIEVGRFDWFGDTDQIVLLNERDDLPGVLFLAVVYIDENGVNTSTPVALVGTAVQNCSVEFAPTGLAVGDFTFNVDDPGTAPPDLAIATLASCPNGDGQVQLFSVDPSNRFAVAALSPAFPVFAPVPDGQTALVASDTQGRSLLLCRPEKVAISQHSQPRIVMGAPPMHIDYVQDPAGSSSSFDLANMTAYPSNDQSSVRGMNSEFDLASSSTVQTQSTNTTSYTYSVSDGVNVNIGFNIPDIASFGASMKYAATTTHAGMVQNKFGIYNSTNFNISTITGLGDVVWYDTNRFNLWIYRVIGHFACPASDTDCDSKLPLYLTFSGPDQINPHPYTPGSQVEWYQPFHEAGNILSYPQSLTQLQQALDPNTDFSSFYELPFTTGSNDDTQTVQWGDGTSSSQSSGSVVTHGSSETETVSAAVSFFGGEGGSFSESKSNSLGTLNQTSQTMAASNGFKVTVPGFNFGETYSYPFVGYLLGLAADPDILQTELQDQLAGEVDQPVNGTLRLAFTAQPDQSSGIWWQGGTAPYLSAPDVALNHPLRWSLLSESSGPLSSVYCFNLLDRTEVEKTGGYEIKGLFILPQGATTGPQQTIATEGDVLQLKARVYNYSRLDMAAGTQVKVQFYGQQWNPSTQELTGNAFLIGEDTLGPIPGNNSSNPGLNASFASVDFNTASCPIAGGCAKKYLKFWLVTWMQSASGGKLVADYQDHGLATLPTKPYTQLGQVPVQPISNNVGYYNQALYVCPAGAQCSTPSEGLTASDALAIESVTASAGKVAALDTVEVRATLRTGAEPVGPVLVAFYDGDPAAGAAPFDLEHVPFIEANATYVSRTRHRPRTPGAHAIHVVAQGGGQQAAASLGLDVGEPEDTACANPLAAPTSVAGHVTRIGEDRGRSTLHMHVEFPVDGPRDLGAARVTVDRLLHEPGGTGELLRQSKGGTLPPLSLAATPNSEPHWAVFQSERHLGQPRVRLALRQIEERK